MGWTKRRYRRLRIKDIWDGYKPIIIIFGSLTLIVGFFISDYIFSSTISYNGIVYEKIYKPSSTSIGTGTDSKGNVGVITIANVERFIILVDTKGSIESVSIESNLWRDLEKGNEIIIEVNNGLFTGLDWNKSIRE